MVSRGTNIDFWVISAKEDAKLLELAKKFGVGHWSKVAKEVGDRTDNQVRKNQHRKFILVVLAQVENISRS